MGPGAAEVTKGTGESGGSGEGRPGGGGGIPEPALPSRLVRTGAPPTTATSPLSRALDVFVQASGARKAILLDAAGRLMAQHGFDGRDAVMQAASLAAGIHASGRRIGRMLGDDGISEVHDVGGTLQLLLSELRTPIERLLLLTVFDADRDLASVRPAYAVFARSVGQLTYLGGEGVEDPEQFEESLMRSLGRLFPGGEPPGTGTGPDRNLDR